MIEGVLLIGSQQRSHGETEWTLSSHNYLVERFSVRNFHCGTFSEIFTADLSLRNLSRWSSAVRLPQ